MSVAAWLPWALTLLGLVYLVTEAAITAPVRVALARLHPLLATLLYCPACSGFWLGLAVAWLYPSGEPWPLRAGLSALGAMALAGSWSKALGGNAAWAAEAALREGEVLGDETTPRTTQDGEGD